ncbi:MAG: 5-formyltetrahydrofolate cyclo-ligase [Parachlamydiales bacterium]|nr:5-formyltetrahydrofolate cyclo-ligase [Parachlamydiales bacterium]
MNDNKSDLRKKFLKIRNGISLTRRAIAEKKIKKLASLNFKNVLSFASKAKEINLWSLNKKLASEKRCFLPKVFKNELRIYKIENIETDLIKGKFQLLEPNPAICEEVDIGIISCVIVPGLVFDKKNNRLGYGRGFYDRFLTQIDCPFIGVGFLEQLTESIPIEKHDIKMNHVLLF